MKGKEAKEIKIPKITIKQEVIDKSYNSSRIVENKEDSEESAVIYVYKILLALLIHINA